MIINILVLDSLYKQGILGVTDYQHPLLKVSKASMCTLGQRHGLCKEQHHCGPAKDVALYLRLYIGIMSSVRVRNFTRRIGYNFTRRIECYFAQAGKRKRFPDKNLPGVPLFCANTHLQSAFRAFCRGLLKCIP